MSNKPGNASVERTQPPNDTEHDNSGAPSDNKKSDSSGVGVLNRVANVISLFLLVLVFVAAVVAIAAGACCLISLSGKPFQHFSLFFAFAVASVVFGVVCLVATLGAVAFIRFCGMGLSLYGMCCAGGSRMRKVLNVCLLGVFPFIIFVILLMLCLFTFAFFGLSKQIPPLDKNYTSVPGITGPVHIMRDENGLVHIKASSRSDAYFGQGFAEAQDRLFQLEFYRLIGRGELSSVVGSGGIVADKSTRLLNIRAAAASLCAKAKSSDLELMEVFADGINYYLKHVSQRPVEFFFMSLKAKPFTYHEPQQFTTEDLCVVSRLLQWQMSSNLAAEGTRFSMFLTSLMRTYEQVESLFNNFSTAQDTILTAEQLGLSEAEMQGNITSQRNSSAIEAETYNTLLPTIRAMLPNAGRSTQSIRSPQAVVQESLENLLVERFFMKPDVDIFATKYIHASNAWAARDSRNRAVGASDPHLPVEVPSVWYSVHLSFPDDMGVPYDATGVGMAGLPGVHIGKTTYVSWGITMSLTDLEDLFVITNPQNSLQAPTNYTYRGNTHLFVARRERIVVRGEADVVLDVEDTLFGPVVNDLVLAEPSPFLKLALYAVPLRHDDDDSLASLLSMSDPSVQTAEQLMTSLLSLRSPGFSIPTADSQGNLAYAVTGRHPLRSTGHTGKFPSLALLVGADTYVSDDPNVPDRLLPPMSNPHFHSPADGTPMHISAANQKIYPEGYPYELGFDYAWAYRGQRLHELLNALQAEEGDQLANITRHAQIQSDIQSNIWVQDYRPVVAAMDLTPESNAAQQWQRRLLTWDAQTPIGSVEAAFFWRWIQSMSVLPLDARVSKPNSRYVWRMMTQGDALMEQQCILHATQLSLKATVTNCTELGRALFVRLANTDFNERWGVDLNHLTAVHKLMHDEIVRPVFERTVEKNGDMSSVCVSGNTMQGKMGSTQASSMRQLYDWSDPDRIYFVLPGGNSGNPYSPYYQNLLDTFGRREYVRLAATARAIEEMISNGEMRHYQVLNP